MKNKIITEDDLVAWSADAVMSQFEYSNCDGVIDFQIDPANNEAYPSQQRMAILALYKKGGIDLMEGDIEGLKQDKLTSFRVKIIIDALAPILNQYRLIGEDDQTTTNHLVITKNGFLQGKSEYIPKDLRTREVLESLYRHKAKNKQGKYTFSTTLTDCVLSTDNHKLRTNTIYHMNKMFKKNKILLHMKIIGNTVKITEL